MYSNRFAPMALKPFCEEYGFAPMTSIDKALIPKK